MVFLLDLKLDVLAYSLNLPPLPLSAADQIANEERSRMGISVIERTNRILASSPGFPSVGSPHL
jgi:hypothetical protein